jgi:N-acetylneuraminic acid mutarotase
MTSWIKTARAAVVAAALMAAVAPAAAQSPGKWSKAAPLPEAAIELYAAVVDAKMYVFGGIEPNGVIPSGLVYEYTPSTDQWAKKKTMALPSHHNAVVALNGKIYLFGGFAKSNTDKPGWLPIANAWEYDPANDSWKALAPMPTPRGAALAVTIDNKIYVIGGEGMHPGDQPRPLWFVGAAHRSLSTVEEYDPATNTWTSRMPMSTPRNHVAGGVVNGKIYVIGGRVGSVFVGSSDNLDLVEVYDPATDKWGASLNRMPDARSGTGWGVYNGKIYVVGGEFSDNRMRGAFRALEAYDPATDRWDILQQLRFPRHSAGTAFIGNKLHVVGGDLQSSDQYGPPTVTATTSHDVYEVMDEAK